MSRKLAQRELQRGASVSTLQRLLGSTTFFGILYMTWVLRSINLVGLGLALLWVLSPLAAQSSLRILSAAHGKTMPSPQLSYLNITGTSNIVPSSDWKYVNDPADGIFTASLVTTLLTNGSSTDLWGNVKVPLLSNLTGDSGSQDWIKVRGGSVVYSSQLGVPIFGLLSNGNTSAIVETSYIHFYCGDLSGLSNKAANVSVGEVPQIRYVGGDRTEASVTWKSLNFSDDDQQDNAPYTAVTCSMSMENIQMDVSCSRSSESTQTQGTCAVTKMRRNQAGDPSFPATLASNSTFNDFADSIRPAVPQGHEDYPTILDSWILDPYGSFWVASTSPNLFEISPEVFSQRLTQMVNSFHMARLGYQYMTRSSLSGLQLTNLGNQTLVKSDAGSAVFTSATGQGIQINSDLTLHANPWWTTAFILSIMVMVAACVTTYYMESTTLIPDVLGYVSTLTRDNRHIPLENVPATLGGLERTKFLGSIALRLGDVTPGDSVGTLGVGTTPNTMRSKPHRIYR